MSRTGKFYQEGSARAGKVEELFSRIAPRYDLINDLQSLGMHRLWKRRLVGLARVPPGGRALDLCCGTGDIVRAIVRAYPRAKEVLGLDFAMPMLEIAARRTTRGQASHGEHRQAGAGTEHEPAAPRIAYVRGDALALPLADRSVDRVTISYGLRNVADISRCLGEVLRVLRPGGQFLILEFGKPDSPLVARLYFAYLRLGVPLFGRLFFGDPDTHGYIIDSLTRFPSQDETAALLRAAGFARVRVEKPLLGVMGILVAEA